MPITDSNLFLTSDLASISYSCVLKLSRFLAREQERYPILEFTLIQPSLQTFIKKA